MHAQLCNCLCKPRACQRSAHPSSTSRNSFTPSKGGAVHAHMLCPAPCRRKFNLLIYHAHSLKFTFVPTLQGSIRFPLNSQILQLRLQAQATCSAMQRRLHLLLPPSRHGPARSSGAPPAAAAGPTNAACRQEAPPQHHAAAHTPWLAASRGSAAGCGAMQSAIGEPWSAGAKRRAALRIVENTRPPTPGSGLLPGGPRTGRRPCSRPAAAAGSTGAARAGACRGG